MVDGELERSGGQATFLVRKNFDRGSGMNSGQALCLDELRQSRKMGCHRTQRRIQAILNGVLYLGEHRYLVHSIVVLIGNSEPLEEGTSVCGRSTMFLS